MRGPQHLPIACLLLGTLCAWPRFPPRYRATFVFIAAVVDFLPVRVRMHPLLFLQAVPSNPFWFVGLSLPSKPFHSAFFFFLFPKEKVCLASPLQALQTSLCSRVMSMGMVPICSLAKGLGQGLLCVMGRASLGAVLLDKPIRGCPALSRDCGIRLSVSILFSKSQQGKDRISKTTYYISRMKLLFLIGLRLLEDKTHLVYFT